MKTIQTILILLFLSLASCSKNDDAPTPAAENPIAISSFGPATGPKNTVVTITGRGFSDNATSNTVTLNGKICPITSATATQLFITIPPAAGSGNIKVTVANFSNESTPFTFIETVTVSTLAGNATAGDVNGTGTNASFSFISDVVTDNLGNVYAADFPNHKIKKITPNGAVTTFAGSRTAGFADGTGTAAVFNNPLSLAIDVAGNIYVFEKGNFKLRKITPAGIVTTLAGSTEGFEDGQSNNAKFSNYVGHMVTDQSGNIFMPDLNNNKIRKVSPTGLVTTFTSGLFSPNAIAIEASGNFYFTQQSATEPLIKKMTPSGIVNTFAGSTPGSADGTVNTAQFNIPSGIAINSKGEIFISEENSGRIRKISPDGNVKTIVGFNGTGFQDGIGAVAKLDLPFNITIDKDDNIYVADRLRVRKIVID